MKTTVLACLFLVSCRVRTPDPEVSPPTETTAPGGQKSAESPPEPQTEAPVGSGDFTYNVFLEPGDLLSQTGATPIRAYLDSTEPVPQTILQELGANLELREVISQKVVPTTVLIKNPARYIPPQDTPKGGTPPASRTTEKAYAELVPSAQLTAQWYAFLLKALPSRTRATPPAKPVATTDGVMSTIFNPGSAPILGRITFCEKGAGAYRVTFVFSENIHYGPMDLQLITVDQIAAGRTCAHATPGGGDLAFVPLDCTGIDSKSPVRVSMRTGLRSLSGVSISTLHGATQVDSHVTVASLGFSSTGCREWRP